MYNICVCSIKSFYIYGTNNICKNSIHEVNGRRFRFPYRAMVHLNLSHPSKAIIIFHYIGKNKKKTFFFVTSRTEFGQQMRSGDLIEYLSLNCLSNGIVSCSCCYFVYIQPRNCISQKFNSCVTDGPMDRRTDGPMDRWTNGQTHPFIEMREPI